MVGGEDRLCPAMNEISEAFTPPPPPVDPGRQPRRFLGLVVHRRVRTGQKQIAWSSVVILSLMWFTFGFHIFAGGQALTFTIQRYNRDPRVISIMLTFAAVIMLSPLISYLSDQVWTPIGRRKPFLIVAWIGGFLGMSAFAFLPQICRFVNGTLHLVGLAGVADIILLAVIVGCYKKMLDCMSPLEPLFLECVPPHQRGRFWAIRGVLFTLAVMFFYQIMWPVFDDPIDLFGYLGFPGALVLKGEQLVYIFSAGSFFITGLFLIFCVEETRVANAPNKSLWEFFRAAPKDGAPPGALEAAPAPPAKGFAEIPIVQFVIGFFRDVFLKVENYAFFVILVIPSMEAAVWGVSFGPLMQNDQFGYSKANQALWAFPIGLLSMFCLTPFAGWYSDVRITVKRWLRIVLLAISAACIAGMVSMYRHYLPESPGDLPDFWVLCAITVLTAASVGCIYVPTVETLLDIVGREHARAWVATLTVCKSIINTVALYCWIRSCPNHIPPILSWMIFGVIGATMGTLMDTFIGPMIYDYMPRNRMGTINSGVGIYTTIVNSIVPNIGAFWVVFYSTHFVAQTGPTLNYDYTSIYLIQFVFFIPTILAKIYFIRLIMKGRMKKLGAMEIEG